MSNGALRIGIGGVVILQVIAIALLIALRSTPPPTGASGDSAAEMQALRGEVAALRSELAALRQAAIEAERVEPMDAEQPVDAGEPEGVGGPERLISPLLMAGMTSAQFESIALQIGIERPQVARHLLLNEAKLIALSPVSLMTYAALPAGPMLSLPGLRELTPRMAAHLATWPGDAGAAVMSLPSVDRLDATTAEALVAWAGDRANQTLRLPAADVSAAIEPLARWCTAGRDRLLVVPGRFHDAIRAAAPDAGLAAE